jgi:ABC-type branched-subunit amino acid transport system ATPase component
MAGLALRLADRAYVIERGRIFVHGAANSIRNDTALTQAYLVA